VRPDIRPSNENIRLDGGSAINKLACPTVEPEIHQVVSSLSTVKKGDYYFDYGNLRDRTCIWISHEHDEVPQLLITKSYSVEYSEFRISEYFSEYKDKFARFRTITSALMLLHNLSTQTQVSLGLFLGFACLVGFVYSLVE